MQQHQTPPLLGLGRLDRIEQPQLIRLEPPHEARQLIISIQPSGQLRQFAQRAGPAGRRVRPAPFSHIAGLSVLMYARNTSISV